MDKLRLHGFNNLTKSLSFNIYDICYARTQEQKQAYIAYIDEVFNADRLTQILTEVADIIGAQVLNVARQDYEPEGASVTILIAEEYAYEGPMPDTVVGHLDKSHITVHTYPEFHPDHGISTFRADIDVSTCGLISPLKALDHLIRRFESDVVTLDYRVRGFTRDVDGVKHFIDHEINSIQDYIPDDIGERYQMVDLNVLGERIFHTKMRLTEFDLDDYLFAENAADLSASEAEQLTDRIAGEITEIFYGRNSD
ncbi:adenosylmethionine decarboxylase [Salinisphaera sp. SPP-AMP-43]|uniref:adenosylmethionine decarboxylase n=1 Tax=Salinisphaera sp. SPP-AMP-43 TaxID=3121288 RepID=UPI003C6E4879